jgi:hypothetical protein
LTDLIYSVGTVSVENGTTTVFGSGMLWNAANAQEWDRVSIDGEAPVDIKSVTDTETLELLLPWAGETKAGVTYKILKDSPLRFNGAPVVQNVVELVNRLNAEGLYLYVPSSATDPTSYGLTADDGQYALQASTGKLWLMESGVWTFVGTLRELGVLHESDEKTTPADDDEIGLLDSAASFVLKKLTWANLKAALKSYFDTLYQAIGGRELLTANRTYYVRADGSDSNDGLSDASGGAFLTWQKAYNVILGLDLGGFTATVQVRDGTYTAGLSITKPALGGSVVFQGNNTTPANVLMSTTSTDAIAVSGQGHYLTFKDFKVQTTTSGSGIHTDKGAAVNLANLNFGVCAGSHLAAENGSQIVYNNGVATISGGATSFSAAYNGSIIAFRGNAVTLSGTPAFSSAFSFGMVNSSTFIDLNTFTGSATGTRYSVILNAVITVGGAGETYLPGNSAGSKATGGQYA